MLSYLFVRSPLHKLHIWLDAEKSRSRSRKELFKVVDGDEIIMTKSIIWCFYSKSWMATARAHWLRNSSHFCKACSECRRHTFARIWRKLFAQAIETQKKILEKKHTTHLQHILQHIPVHPIFKFVFQTTEIWENLVAFVFPCSSFTCEIFNLKLISLYR